MLSTRAKDLAEELRETLNQKFHIALKVREIGEGKGFRVYQVRSEGNRHLVDLRAVSELPDFETIENIKILSPLELIVSKVISYQSRRGNPKSGTDWRDLGVLLLRFPELKKKVTETLQARNISKEVLKTWAEIEGQNFEFGDEDQNLIF